MIRGFSSFLLKLLLVLSLTVFMAAGGASAGKKKEGCPEIDGKLLLKAMSKLYGKALLSSTREAKIKSCFNPAEGKEWRIVVYQLEMELPKSRSTFPVVTVQLGDRVYFAPSLISVDDNPRNWAHLWTIHLSRKVDLPLKEEFLIAGDPEKCSHFLAVFTDPECPFCQRFVPQYARMAAGAGMCVYHYCYPLDFHRNAEKYCRMLDVTLKKLPVEKRLPFLESFYEHTKKKKDPESLALNASGLTSERFYKELVEDDSITETKNLARTLNVRGTPTFFVDGKRVPNDMVADYIDFLLKEENKRKKND